MYVIKKDHEHEMECHPRRSQSAKQRVEVSPQRSERKVKIRKLFNDNPKQYVYADALIPDLQLSLELNEQFVFEFMTARRKQIELNVFTSIVQDQSEYLSRLFRGEEAENQNNSIKEEIKDIIQSSINLICTEIMNDDSYKIKRAKKKVRKEDIMLGGGNPEAIIKVRQRLLKAKLSDLRVDMKDSSVKNNSSNISADPLSPDIYGRESIKKKKAEQFVKNMQKIQDNERRQKNKKEHEKLERLKRGEQQKRQMEIRLKQQKHQFLKKQYEEKRRLKQEQRKEQEQKKQKFQEYYKEYKEKKPLFKKNKEEFFKSYVVPQNNKKLAILSEIKKEHQPITHQQLKEHEKQYMQIREQNEFEKNAARMMELKARKPIPKYYKSKHHSEIQKQFEEEVEDPSEKRTQLHEKRFQYSTQIKTKFAPKISAKKRNQWMSRIQEQKTKQKQKNRMFTSNPQADGKNNLDRLHKYIAQLKGKGKVREANTSQTIEYTTKPVYKNYLREIDVSKSARHSIDYSSLDDAQYTTFEIKKKEESALRREHYLNNIRSMDMDTYMSEKKKLDEDFLESAKAKMAILHKYQ